MIIRFFDADINREIYSTPGMLTTIETDSPHILRDVANALMGYDEDGKIRLFNNKDKELKYEKDYIVIVDYLDDDFISKNITAKFHKYVAEYYKSDLETKRILMGKLSCVSDYLRELLLVFDVEYDINPELSLEEVLKMFKLSLKTEFDSYFEKIIYYTEVIGELRLTELLVLFNPKSFFTQKELELIGKSCAYRNIEVLVIEGKTTDKTLPYENRYQIDEDLFIVKRA